MTNGQDYNWRVSHLKLTKKNQEKPKDGESKLIQELQEMRTSREEFETSMYSLTSQRQRPAASCAERWFVFGW